MTAIIFLPLISLVEIDDGIAFVTRAAAQGVHVLVVMKLSEVVFHVFEERCYVIKFTQRLGFSVKKISDEMIQAVCDTVWDLG